MTPEQTLAIKLDSIRDSIVGSKFTTDNLENRVDKIDKDLYEFRTKVNELNSASIVVTQQLSTINKSMDVMSADIRSVRNSVLSAILGAVLIWVGGTAFSTLHLGDKLPRSTPAVSGKIALKLG